MDPNVVTVLSHINAALWIMAILAIIGTIVFIVTLYYIIKLTQKIIMLVEEIKAQTKVISDKLDPLVNSAVGAFRELKDSTSKLNQLIGNFTETTNNIINFMSGFSILRGLIPGKKFGFWSGVASGLNIIGGIKKAADKKKRKK